jgi:hypothetical protein
MQTSLNYILLNSLIILAQEGPKHVGDDDDDDDM